MKDLDSGEEIQTRKVELRQDGYGGNISSLKRVQKIVYVVPQRIEAILRGMTQRYQDSEFSFLLKSTFLEEKGYYRPDENDIFIPKQRVSRAFVEYLEDAPTYNTVIHKHPDGCRGFSATDRNYINGNFRFSILWVDNMFAAAIANIKLEDGIFMEVPMEIVREEMIPLFPAVAQEKIITANQNCGLREDLKFKGSKKDLLLFSKQEKTVEEILKKQFGDRVVDKNIHRIPEHLINNGPVDLDDLKEMSEDYQDHEDALAHGCHGHD